MRVCPRCQYVFPRGLTPRQVEVLTALAQGRSTGSIALRLGVSPKTVQTHYRHLAEHFGVHGIRALIVAACQWQHEQRTQEP